MINVKKYTEVNALFFKIACSYFREYKNNGQFGKALNLMGYFHLYIDENGYVKIATIYDLPEDANKTLREAYLDYSEKVDNYNEYIRKEEKK